MSLVALVGLNSLIENPNLQLFSMPLLMISVVQLALIVFRHVFSENADIKFPTKDLFFFVAMTVFSRLMYAHLGILSQFEIG